MSLYSQRLLINKEKLQLHQNISPWQKIPLDFCLPFAFSEKESKMQLVLLERQMELGAFCSILLLHIAGEASPSHICHLLVKLHREREFLRQGNVAKQPLPMPSLQCHGREGISTSIRILRGAAGAGGGVPDVFMVLEDSWQPAAGGARIHPGMDPACIPADPCATAGKQPGGQETRIWGSGYPWVPTSCGPGEPLHCQMEIPFQFLSNLPLLSLCSEIQGHTVPLVLAMACLGLCKY